MNEHFRRSLVIEKCQVKDSEPMLKYFGKMVTCWEHGDDKQ